MQLKAITIQQPWAWAIAAGHKRVENRKIRTHCRGPIAIHAGKSEAWLPHGLAFLDQEQGIKPPRDFVFGAVIATAELVDCVPCTYPGGCYVRNGEIITDPYAFGPWCWVLANVRPLATPFPCRGQQGWFSVEIPALASS